ncbi:MAG: glycosyltransferase family 2 protein [Acidobacteriota bacterium]
MAPPEHPRASVVVCTMNRSKVLAEACESALRLQFDAPWELLIIDNGSTDDTLEIAHGLRRRHPDRVRVEQEGELGLSAARNAGIRHARGEILAFLDDDAFPEASWLQDLDDALSGDGVLAAGGPVDPLFQGELPEWFDDRYLPYVTVWDLGPEPVDLAYNEYPRGANMAFHRDAFGRFGWFTTYLGRKGKSLLSCEETELCLRIERGGFRVVYVPGARVQHMVNAERIDEGWLVDRFAAQGGSEAIVDWMHGGLAGLRRGRARFRRNAEAAAGETGPGADLYRRVQRASLKGYTAQALRCPLRVPRYRPVADAADWLPFA